MIHHFLPHLLSLRGQLVLHAAAVVVGGRAHLILGRAGIGKSTLAHYFSKAGYLVLSDDAVLIQKKGGKYFTSASTPMVRLKGRGLREKSVVETTGTSRSFQIASVNLPVLKSRSRRVIAYRPNPKQTLSLMLPEVFRLDLDNQKLNTSGFRQIVQLCRKVPILAWSYSHRPRAKAQVRKLLENFK
jgi:hypothetical protein